MLDIARSWRSSHLHKVLAAQESRIEVLKRRLVQRGIMTYEDVAPLPRGSSDYLLIQSIDLLEKGHQLCKLTVRQIERSSERLIKR